MIFRGDICECFCEWPCLIVFRNVCGRDEGGWGVLCCFLYILWQKCLEPWAGVTFCFCSNLKKNWGTKSWIWWDQNHIAKKRNHGLSSPIWSPILLLWFQPKWWELKNGLVMIEKPILYENQRTHEFYHHLVIQDCSPITKVKDLMMHLPFFPQQGQSSSAEEWKTLLQLPYPKNLVNRVNGIMILDCMIILYSVLI